MPCEVSIHDLRDRTDTVAAAAVRAGKCLTLTIDGEAVADIVPQAACHSPLGTSGGAAPKLGVCLLDFWGCGVGALDVDRGAR